MSLHTIGTAILSRLPPSVSSMAKLAYGRLSHPRYGWFGDYPSWADAEAASGGYDRLAILERVRDSMLKVKRGEAVHERDSVLFDKVEYSWPLLAGLMWVAAQHEGVLSVLDFGGSLGTTYFQNRAFLANLKKVRWSIVEQPHFVACGREHFATDQLRFYDTVEDCLRSERPDVIVLSGVLQYLEHPYQQLQVLVDLGVPHLIVDLAPVFARRDRITVQKVPPEIYDASYPCWIFAENRLRAFLNERSHLVADFDCVLGQSLNLGWGSRAKYRGYILAVPAPSFGQRV
jgi:putative methyltransferase (TIGR04325 family)